MTNWGREQMWRRAQMQNYLHHNTQFFHQTPRTYREAFGESISEEKAADVVVVWVAVVTLILGLLVAF